MKINKNKTYYEITDYNVYISETQKVYGGFRLK